MLHDIMPHAPPSREPRKRPRGVSVLGCPCRPSCYSWPVGTTTSTTGGIGITKPFALRLREPKWFHAMASSDTCTCRADLKTKGGVTQNHKFSWIFPEICETFWLWDLQIFDGSTKSMEKKNEATINPSKSIQSGALLHTSHESAATQLQHESSEN